MTGADLKQRLVAILAADAAGYSRLMSLDERATVAALDVARSVFHSQTVANQGRVVDTAGDSVLAVFETAAGALNAALQIQAALAEAHTSTPIERRMLFRIGIHSGDVMEKADGSVYGDGVNIAARLQGLAEPGQITVSDAIHGAVRGKVSASFTDQGEQQVKNIEHPVRAYRVWMEGAAGASGSTITTKSSAQGTEIDLSLPDKPSIAVLAFVNMSGDPEQEYLTDGITEDIITELSRFHSLFVIARNSSFTYKGKPVDVRKVAKELGVRYVLEGSIRKSANRIRVTGQLIDALTGNHIWAEKYDRVLEDVFAVQEEVTQAIVRTIAPQIETAERLRAVRRHPANLSAYEIAVRAWANAVLAFFNLDPSVRSRSIEEANAALAIDPGNTLALNTLAFAHYQNVTFGTTSDVANEWSAGIVAARRAIELDPSDSLGYTCKGMLLCFPPQPPGTAGYVNHNDEALDNLQRAHELNPNDVFVLQLLGACEVAVGMASQAIEHLKQALRNSPRGSWSANIAGLLSWACIYVKDYSSGHRWALRALHELPDLHSALSCLTVHCVGLGEIEQAKTALEAVRRLVPTVVESRLKGVFYNGSAQDRKRQHVFWRIAAGLEDPSAADVWR